MSEVTSKFFASELSSNYISYFKNGVGLRDFEFENLADGALTFALSGWDDPFFNVVLHSSVSSDVDRGHVKNLLEKLSARKIPFRWKVKSSQPSLQAYLRAAGLVVVDRAVTYCFDASLQALRPVDSCPLQLTVVADPASEALWWRPFMSAFGVKNVLKTQMLAFNRQARGAHAGRFQNLVFTLGNSPVCSVTLFESDGVTGIYDVGVDVVSQRRGVGFAAMVQSISYALRHRRTPLCLYSTPGGRRLYEKVGFVRGEAFDFYGPP